MNKIEIDFNQIDLPFQNLTSTDIEKIVFRVVEHLPLKRVDLTFIFTNNNEIQNINKKYRSKDYPTDVISFAYRDNFFPKLTDNNEYLGDIFVSLEKVYEQSLEDKADFSQEVIKIVIHGLLHLLGYDHEKGLKEAVLMKEKEIKIFNKISCLHKIEKKRNML